MQMSMRINELNVKANKKKFMCVLLLFPSVIMLYELLY